MDNLMKIKQFLRDEQGLTVVEYVVGAAFLVSAVALVFSNMGSDLSTKMDSTLSKAGS